MTEVLSEKVKEEAAKQIPMGSFGKPEDIAAAVAFHVITLPVELTNNINGEVLFTEVLSLTRMFRFSKKRDNIIITLDIIKLDKHFI